MTTKKEKITKLADKKDLKTVIQAVNQDTLEEQAQIIERLKGMLEAAKPFIEGLEHIFSSQYKYYILANPMSESGNGMVMYSDSEEAIAISSRKLNEKGIKHKILSTSHVNYIISGD